MQRTKKIEQKLSDQMKNRQKIERDENKGDFTRTISTGSTLLDLAISGGVKRGGGIPAGILVEIFGTSGSGKTVMLSEIAGNIQRKGGDVLYHDPEARLNKTFASMFGLNLPEDNYTTPDTVTEVFTQVRNWKPEGKYINAIFADSLAALSTDMEMDNKDGDKMGMRRAKEFSEQLRKTCRVLAKNNWLMVCSNQVRQNADAGAYGEKYTTPGGVSIGFYSSLRLRTKLVEKIKQEVKIVGKDVKRIIGIKTEIEVYKSSIWKPYHTAPVYILFDYGIDDIRANLQFIKDFTKNNTYTCDGESIGMSLEKAIKTVEDNNLQKTLRNEVIELWTEIEEKFEMIRIPKHKSNEN